MWWLFDTFKTSEPRWTAVFLVNPDSVVWELVLPDDTIAWGEVFSFSNAKCVQLFGS